MDIKKLTQEVLLKNMTPEQQLAVLDSVTASVKEAKAVQKQKIAENVDLVLQALKRIEADMLKRVDGSAQIVEDRVKSIKDGKDGKNGLDGKAGKDGVNGKDGKDGRDGRDGLNGKAGERGQDGVGVQDAHIDFDGSLIISLTNGQELNVGEVIPFDVAEKIKVIGNGGGTSQYVLDAIAALQAEIDNFEALPSQTGNAGKFLTTDGTTASWASVAGGLSYQGTWNAYTNTPTLASSTGTNGYYYIVSTAGSTNLNGITDWQIGDWLLFNGSTWQKLDQTNLVTSVAGRTGAITLSNSDVSGSAASGANSDITAMSGITGGITTPDYITFDVNPSTIPTAPGSLYWDSANGNKTLSLVMEGGAATQQIGEEQYYRVRADAAITNGQVVMLTGTVGATGVLKASPATGLTADTAVYVLGVATQDIAHNDYGYITSFGLVRDIDTRGGAESWVDGQLLYLNPSVAGGLTKYAPAAPNPKVQVCAVVNAANVGSGSLFVRPSFGGVLGQYEGDVDITSPANGQLLIRDQTSGKWVNTTLTDGTGILVTEGAGSVTVGIDTTVATLTGTQTLQNKTLDNTNTATLKDTLFTLQDDADTTKQAKFQLSGIGTGTTVTYSLPYAGTATATLVDLLSAQTINGIKIFSSSQQNIGSSTGNSTGNFAYGATTSGNTKAVNIGTAGLSGSTTNITLGSAVSGSTTNVAAYGTWTFNTPLAGTNLANTAVTAGSYTAANITVDAQGRITSASSGTAGASISNDTSTSSNVYPLFAAATSGTPTTIYTSNALYLYKPSTGELQSSHHVSTNGITINGQTISTSYTISSGQSGVSAGPVTIASGVTVTVSSGSKWVIL